MPVSGGELPEEMNRRERPVLSDLAVCHKTPASPELAR
jgi:hypothetical protein